MEGRNIEHEQPRDTREITEGLFGRLPEIAKQLTSKYLNQSIESNRRLTQNPDDPAEHQPQWHEWGIVTHTRMVDQYMRDNVPVYLKEWGLDEQVMSHMDERIGDKTKWELMQISTPLHDLGKFAKRQVYHNKRKKLEWSYDEHEQKSGEIVRFPAFTGMLRDEYGLTREQIEYVAQCAERHYELAYIRDKAKTSQEGFTLKFIHGDTFEEPADELMKKFKGYEPELGLYYLADSLAKVEVHIPAETDEDIVAQESVIQDKIQELGLDPKLAGAIRQNPVSVASAKRFLQMWAAGPR